MELQTEIDKAIAAIDYQKLQAEFQAQVSLRYLLLSRETLYSVDWFG